MVLQFFLLIRENVFTFQMIKTALSYYMIFRQLQIGILKVSWFYCTLHYVFATKWCWPWQRRQYPYNDLSANLTMTIDHVQCLLLARKHLNIVFTFIFQIYRCLDDISQYNILMNDFNNKNIMNDVLSQIHICANFYWSGGPTEIFKPTIGWFDFLN